MASLATNGESSETKIPKWAIDHFKKSTNAHERLHWVLTISEQGIRHLQSMPKIVDAIAMAKDALGTDPVDLDKHVKDVEAAKKAAGLATHEINSDFPVLHTLAVVALWSWLENFVKGYVALWLLHRPDSSSVLAVQKLKVELGKYIHLSKEEQADYIVELLEAGVSPDLKRRGAERFECLLEPFGLSVNPGADQRKQLLELQQIRHVVAHRNGIADRRLHAACPWVKATLGQPIQVTGEMIGRYFQAAALYSLEIFYRVGDIYEVNLRPDLNK